MPIDDIQCLDIDQVARISDFARAGPILKNPSLQSAANELVREVNLDFARTMNKIILVHQQQQQDATQTDPEAAGLTDGSSAPRGCAGLLESIDIDVLEDDGDNSFARLVPWFALWPVPEYGFTETFSQFCFASLF